MDRFVNNLVGTFGLAVSDVVTESVAEVVGHAGALGAAVSYLFQKPGCGIEQLREPLGLSQPAAVRLVQQMVEAGLATRSSDSSDRRRVQIHLTRHGRAVAESLLAARRNAVDSLLSGLSPAEQDSLAALISKALAAAVVDRAHGEQMCRLCDVPACPDPRCPIEASICARSAAAQR
ncbi:MAG TPA: MarR family winged helix-turn-helix transcriptional regulator [Streptosporangiaceae bacterium]